jgi:hypothetical protein
VETSNGGLLFDDLHGLTAALRLMEDQPERRLAMGRAGHAAFLAHWSERAVVPRYLDLVARLQARRDSTQRRGADSPPQTVGGAAAPETPAACEPS